MKIKGKEQKGYLRIVKQQKCSARVTHRYLVALSDLTGGSPSLVSGDCGACPVHWIQERSPNPHHQSEAGEHW